jgi:hypothetical protein
VWCSGTGTTYAARGRRGLAVVGSSHVMAGFDT